MRILLPPSTHFLEGRLGNPVISFMWKIRLRRLHERLVVKKGGFAGGVVGLSENSFTPFAFGSPFFFKSDLLNCADWILDNGKESNSFFWWNQDKFQAKTRETQRHWPKAENTREDRENRKERRGQFCHQKVSHQSQKFRPWTWSNMGQQLILWTEGCGWFQELSGCWGI